MCLGDDNLPDHAVSIHPRGDEVSTTRGSGWVFIRPEGPSGNGHDREVVDQDQMGL